MFFSKSGCIGSHRNIPQRRVGGRGVGQLPASLCDAAHLHRVVRWQGQAAGAQTRADHAAGAGQCEGHQSIQQGSGRHLSKLVSEE